MGDADPVQISAKSDYAVRALLGALQCVHRQTSGLGDVGLSAACFDSRGSDAAAKASSCGGRRTGPLAMAFRRHGHGDTLRPFYAASGRASCAIDNRDGGGVCLMGMTPRDRRRGAARRGALSCNDG